MTSDAGPPQAWQRLSPRMLLVHPVHEVLRQLPLLVGSIVLGSATNNRLWSLLGLAVIVGLGIARWFTTTYRIDDDANGNVQLRSGVLQRNVLSVPRNRIRSVQTDARLLHRLLGLTVLRVSTGQEGKGDSSFELDAVQVDEVSRLRAILLSAAAPDSATTRVVETQLARWAPTWLRYSPLSFSGLLMIAAAVGLWYQTGFGQRFWRTRIAESGLDAAQRFGVAASVSVVVTVIVLASVVLAVGRSLLTFGNLVLTRRPGADGDTVHLRHGLVRVRERTYDMRRLRGGTLREPLLVRAFGGARLDAVMTGVNGAGEASLLLPPCPADTAARVLTGLIGDADAVAAPVRPHGRAAARRRWTRALTVPAVVAVGLAVLALRSGVPQWVWPALVVLTGCCALLAADRVRALGHRVDGDWLVARSGSVERRRDCIATPGIIGWTVRQTLFQRRAGVATLVAATAAGTKRYEVLDIPVEMAWAVAAEASPWVAKCAWSVAEQRC
ncbi:PH domain-containing protein [soil metagenome]